MKGVFYLIPSIIWTITIISASLLSLRNLKKLQVDSFLGMDKVAHAIMYGGLCFLLLWGIKKYKTLDKLTKKTILYVMSFSIALGVTMEVLQKLAMNGRNFDYYDIIANIIGAFLGTALFLTRNK